MQKIFTKGEASDKELQELLKAREEKKFDFKLIDIREIYEYSDMSIDGTDLLYPTTLFHKYIEELQKIKDENIFLYCRTGNRTGQVLMILRRMDFENIAHLSQGIVTYTGKMSRRAKLPKNI